MINQKVQIVANHIFGKPDAFADILNVFLYKEKRILPEMISDCSQELYAIVDEQMHFSQRITVTKLVNDGTKEDIVTIEFIKGSDKIIIWSHPNNYIH